MRMTRSNGVLASGLLAIAALACSMSTANLSSLKLGKDKSVSTETSTFSASDTVYAVATVSNAPGKVKVKGRVLFDDVPGQQAGPAPGFEKTLDLPGSGTATFYFTATDGWPKGKYKVETTLLDENDAQKDQKTASFTVS